MPKYESTITPVLEQLHDKRISHVLLPYFYKFNLAWNKRLAMELPEGVIGLLHRLLIIVSLWVFLFLLWCNVKCFLSILARLYDYVKQNVKLTAYALYLITDYILSANRPSFFNFFSFSLFAFFFSLFLNHLLLTFTSFQIFIAVFFKLFLIFPLPVFFLCLQRVFLSFFLIFADTF